MAGQENASGGFTEADVHRAFGYVTVKDGIRLAYVLWRAKGDGRFPTILNYSTYAESGTAFADAKRFLDAGYAYLGVNVRGTGASEGAYSYYQPLEGSDGAEVVEWAAAQPWSTGAVGMIGASYGGHTQVKVASHRPPHLKAIVPVATEGSEYRDEGRTGGLFNAALMAIWTFDIQPQLARTGAEARMKGGDTECEKIRAVQPANPAYDEALEHDVYDDWWKARALETMVEKITVPTLFIHAWQDEWIRPNGVLRLFKLSKSEHKRIIVQNGPHRLSRYRLTQKEQMRWLDRWVKGEDNGAEKEPAVTIHWEVTEADDPAVSIPAWTTTYPAWPAPQLQWTTFHLTAAGELHPQTGSQGVRRYVYPLGTELAGSNAQFALPPHPQGSLSYRTAPMTEDMALLGAPRLQLFFSTDRDDADLMFTLKDIDPAGNTLFLQRSVLRASMRAVDRELSTSDEIMQSFAKPEKLKPGEIVEINVSLSALGHVVRKGHRLELSVLAPNPTPNPVWGFVPIAAPATHTVHHGPAHPSQLRLPVVPEEGAQKPAPKLGVLKNQPYRAAPPAIS